MFTLARYINVRYTQQAIVDYLRNNPETTIGEIAQAIDCHEQTVIYNLRQLRAAKIIKRLQRGRYGQKSVYQVTVHEQNGHTQATD